MIVDKSMVGNFIMPVTGVATSGVDFADQFIALNGQAYETLKMAQDAGAPLITYGVSINAVINFLIVVFMLVKGVNKIKAAAEAEAKAKEEAAPAKPSEDIVLLAEIRDLLKNSR